MTPAEYIRLRRQAAGLSVEQVAAALAPERDKRGAARAFLGLIETKGAKVNTAAALHLLRRIFPFDIDVYHQLANDPADRHPTICRARGCSSWDFENACAPGHGCQA